MTNVSSRSRNYKYHIWRSRSKCLTCGLCCKQTEMILLPSDIKRIKRHGYKISFFAKKKGKVMVLRNKDGYCVFYDKASGRCKIYEIRPLGCALYPIVLDLEREIITVDTLCPLYYDTEIEELLNAKKYIMQVIDELGMDINKEVDVVKRTLKIIKEMGVISKQLIARKLGLPEPIVDKILSYLK
ncbi:MAG: hypothetical protein DRP08_06725, partial [Candidatus Aenigmatarchaeota archaeon]